MQGIKFSIVIPTLNRVTEVDAVLGSIAHQAYQDLEVIIVDQNGDDRLAAVVAKHSNELRIQHFRVAFRGASKARNYGARYASGAILFFPDDDAELLPDFLRNAAASFSENPNCDVIFGKCVDRLGHGDHRQPSAWPYVACHGLKTPSTPSRPSPRAGSFARTCAHVRR